MVGLCVGKDVGMWTVECVPVCVCVFVCERHILCFLLSTWYMNRRPRCMYACFNPNIVNC